MCVACSRRGLLAGIASLALSRSAYAQSNIKYCSAEIGGALPSNTSSTSGNKAIDRAMIVEVQRILNFIPVNPGFRFVDDNSPNAFAVKIDLIAGTKGTVFIGRNLVNNEFDDNNLGGIAVAGIVAHECAHIYQYDSGIYEELDGVTHRNIELHADYLAGDYFGRSNTHTRENVNIFANSLFRKGDFDFNDVGHHGSPDARVRAMNAGYHIGSKQIDFYTSARNAVEVVKTIQD